jgi:hypothetical protein
MSESIAKKNIGHISGVSPMIRRADKPVIKKRGKGAVILPGFGAHGPTFLQPFPGAGFWL